MNNQEFLEKMSSYVILKATYCHRMAKKMTRRKKTEILYDRVVVEKQRRNSLCPFIPV